MNFQDIISALSAYWGRQQCINFHPYDVEKGAGTRQLSFASWDRSRGTYAMWNRPAARLTDVMAITLTAFISIISSRSS